ncbi:hypothetical protein CTAYLR_005833 [Chrysophaeum taylorii]|uniref:Aspartyl/asparaginy/proline hydroxylase domain-containing protein n=1 Tax=Chrysophaeum taylorii TaxID=2483200 RepID=A0AAD7UQG7_9STRA|nr:hypothetical protein CTAYLR_005833 [Chrysophaeum taylorii]
MEACLTFGDVTLKISVPAAKISQGFAYRRLLAAFHKHYRSKHPECPGVEDLWLEDGDGHRVRDDALAPAGAVSLAVRNSVWHQKARAACASFGTLELVEGKPGSCAGQRGARLWFLRRGVLSARAASWALREASCEDDRWRRDAVLAYKLGFACRRESKLDDAVTALAKAATTMDDLLEPAWLRKAYHEWAAAVADRDTSDRWTEVAVHKLGVERGVWHRWDQRPLDRLLPNLRARPVWGDHPILHLLEPFDDDLPQHPTPGTIALPENSNRAFPRASARASELLASPHRVRRCFIRVTPPRTHLPTTCASTNVLLRAELDLRGRPSYLRVADELVDDARRRVYDPSFEHELWYEGDTPRLTFVCDFAHPDLPDDDNPAIARLLCSCR